MKFANMALLAAGLFTAGLEAEAQDAPFIGKHEVTVKDGRMTPEILWSFGRIGSAVLSPNGQQLVYTVSYYSPELAPVMDAIHTQYPEVGKGNVGIGSTIFAVKPGDGSAREQAASCQKVLGGWANIANEYATKRYRSNLINWGMLPFLIDGEDLPFANGDFLFIPDVRDAVIDKLAEIKAYVVKDGALKEFTLKLGELTDDEREIILKGCLINYNRV